MWIEEKLEKSIFNVYMQISFYRVKYEYSLRKHEEQNILNKNLPHARTFFHFFKKQYWGAFNSLFVVELSKLKFKEWMKSGQDHSSGKFWETGPRKKSMDLWNTCLLGKATVHSMNSQTGKSLFYLWCPHPCSFSAWVFVCLFLIFLFGFIFWLLNIFLLLC